MHLSYEIYVSLPFAPTYFPYPSRRHTFQYLFNKILCVCHVRFVPPSCYFPAMLILSETNTDPVRTMIRCIVFRSIKKNRT